MKSVFSIACRNLFSVQFGSVPLQFSVWKAHTNRENGNKMQTSSSAMWHRKPTNCVVYFEYSLRLWIHIYTYMPWWYLRKMTSFSVSLFVHSHIQYAWWCSLFTVKRWHQTKLRSRYSNIVPTHERKTTLYDRIRFCANRAYTI